MLARYPPWYQGWSVTSRSVALKTIALATASRYHASLKPSEAVFPLRTDTSREGREVLLRPETHLVGAFLPDVDELCQVRLREELPARVLQIELLALGRRETSASVRILSSGSLVEPLRLSERAVR